jgi:hypothetical protein
MTFKTLIFYILCFFYLAHIHVRIGYHWVDTVKFLPEYYPVVQFWGNTQTYQHSAHSVTSDLFYPWCIFDAFSIWHKFVLWSVLRQVDSLFQKEFSVECDLVLHPYIKYHLFSLRSFSSCLRLLPRLSVTSFHPSVLPSFVLLHVGYSCPFCLWVVLHFSHGLFNWSSPSLLVYYLRKIKRIRQTLFPATVSSNRLAVHCYAFCLSKGMLIHQ